jgi:hypothetical protein
MFLRGLSTQRKAGFSRFLDNSVRNEDFRFPNVTPQFPQAFPDTRFAVTPRKKFSFINHREPLSKNLKFL